MELATNNILSSYDLDSSYVKKRGGGGRGGGCTVATQKSDTVEKDTLKEDNLSTKDNLCICTQSTDKLSTKDKNWVPSASIIRKFTFTASKIIH